MGEGRPGRVRWPRRTHGPVAFLALAAACAGPRAVPPSPAGGDLLIENVRVFDPRAGAFTGPLDLLVRDRRVAAVGDPGPVPGAVPRLDAAGRYALPGLWDSHVHLSWLTLGGDSAVAATLEAFLRAGITNVRDVGGPLDVIASLSRRVALGDLPGPRIHYAGPLLTQEPLGEDLARLNGVLPGTAVVVGTAAEIDAELDRLVRAGATLTKAIDRWDPPVFRHHVAAARERSLPVVLDPGAPLLNAVRADTALALGVTSIEHAQGVWSSVLAGDLDQELTAFMASGAPPAEGEDLVLRIMTLGEASVDPARLAALAAAWRDGGAYFCPTLARADDYRTGDPPDRVRRALDGRRAAARRFVAELSRRGVPLLVGQDGTEPEGTLAEMEALADAGVAPVEILRAATLHPAGSLGLADRFGTLEAGHTADIVIIDADPLERIGNVRSVWRVVYEGRVLAAPR